MSKFHFWATVVTAFILGLVGVLLGGALPLPSPFTTGQTRAVYGLIGVLVGLLTFASLASWVVKTTTRLVKQVTTRVAFEIINQLTNLSSRGLSLLPTSGRTGSTGSGEDNLSIGGAMILDTSCIIDGRILDVAKTGFLAGLILVPGFVLTELQQVADSADAVKRARGRRGFEIIDALKKVGGLKLEVWDKDLAGKTVDDKLVRLGKALHGRVVTCDFNLNRVATLRGVRVLNLNELANSLKTLPVPGEELMVKIIQPGKDKNQGVGYLRDGTMVVVKEAASLIGREINIEVAKIIQGPAGRMIFGKKVEQ
ncbi:MAG: hypothetical protein M1142_06550 [Patescibacteria group bacterium]|nr:hypothetical protein [Patescibacteria group bacterium]